MKKFSLLMATALLLVLSVVPAFAQEAVEITWFVGLGTGSNPEQQEAQEGVVAAFNEMQDEIELNIVFVTNDEAPQTLATLIATGESPDIVGPVGFAGTAQFVDNLLDIEPYVEASGYDLSQFDTSLVDFNRLADQGLVGLPFAVFPSFIYYRPALFDEAGLEYPPAEYGAPYMLDGEEVEWNTETLREVAMLLTVDSNGYDATEPEFDPESIEQWGFINQWNNMRQQVTMFGACSMLEDNGDGTYTAVMCDEWREGFHWLYNGIWEDHFIPTASQEAGDLLASGNAFASGNLAMAQSHLWYTCCLEDTDWQAGATPSYNGATTTRLHADTFRILDTTEHPEEAFEVLTYLTGEASLDLFGVYGGLPARATDRDAFFAGLDEKYTQGVIWDVALAGLQTVDIPSHEEALPNNNEAFARLQSFNSLIQSEPGLDIDAEIDTLLADLTVIFNKED